MHNQNNYKSKVLMANELLFHENEIAENMYIIKTGMIRIFKKKGKGFVEIAVLHKGEIIGEMALFKESHRKRNASAEAIVQTELYEVKLDNFSKIYENLNPWFRTILDTLVMRLNSGVTKVVAFEDNSVSIDYKELRYGGTYNFFKDIEVIRIFSVFYMAFESQKRAIDEAETSIHLKTLNLFANDIFGFSEVKILEFRTILESVGLITVEKDDEDLKITTKDVELFKKLFIFLNKERHLDDFRRMKLTPNCIHLLEEIEEAHLHTPYKSMKPVVEIQGIIDYLRETSVVIDQSDYIGAIKNKLIEEPYFNSKNEAICVVDLQRMLALLPILRIKCAFEEFNRDKRQK